MPNLTHNLKKAPHKIFDVVRSIILKANYYSGQYKSSVWLFGDGRSGTTFVSDLINYNAQYREMFEPFHPVFVKQMQRMCFHQYIRPNSETHSLYRVGSDVFSGRLTSTFVDSANTKLRYKNLLIKDIFVNLLARWAVTQFKNTDIKPILLIRNPYAVALSKFKKKNWNWMTDPKDFLKQKELVEDYLHPFIDVINGVGEDYIERQVMIWSIIHYVPFLQFGNEDLYVLFYENLITNPESEVRSLLAYINPLFSENDVQKIIRKMEIPSRVSGPESTIIRGSSPIDSWQKEISEIQMQKGNQILKSFGLDKIYGESTQPQILTTEELFSKSQ